MKQKREMGEPDFFSTGHQQANAFAGMSGWGGCLSGLFGQSLGAGFTGQVAESLNERTKPG